MFTDIDMYDNTHTEDQWNRSVALQTLRRYFFQN